MDDNLDNGAKKLPRLTYLLLSHNREKYIRGAIESAFAQDYEGELEYIFSDDCSTDATFEIIKECVAAYKGDRRVVVVQTPSNMHLARHTNFAVQFATGDYVIRADDDDISTIDRCSIIGNLVAQYPGCSCVQTRCIKFYDSQEADIKKLASSPQNANQVVKIFDVADGYDGMSCFDTDNPCNKAWSKAVYDKFSPLPAEGYYVDDVICQYRANALNFYVSTSAVTVMARQTSENMSCPGNVGNRGYNAIMQLEKFNDKYFNITYGPLTEAIAEIESYMRKHRPAAYAKSGRFFEKLRKDLHRHDLLRTYWRRGTVNRFRIKKQLGYKGLFSIMRCLPLSVFARLLSWYRLFSKK